MSIAEKFGADFDNPRTGPTLEMIRMPLTAPAAGFARSTSLIPTFREFSIKDLDERDLDGND
jgi:hypothetical protein